MKVLSMCGSQEFLKMSEKRQWFSIAPKIKGGVMGTSKKFNPVY
jgi:hypothetical protein